MQNVANHGFRLFKECSELLLYSFPSSSHVLLTCNLKQYSGLSLLCPPHRLIQEMPYDSSRAHSRQQKETQGKSKPIPFVEEIGRGRKAAGQFSGLEEPSEGALWARHSQVVGADRALVVIRGAICATNGVQVPRTGYQGFSILGGCCSVPGAVNLAKQGQVTLEEPVLGKKSWFETLLFCISASNVSVTGQNPVTLKLNFQQIIFLNIILVLQESSKRMIMEKRSFSHKNMYKIFGLVSLKKNLELGKKYFSRAVNLNSTVSVFVLVFSTLFWLWDYFLLHIPCSSVSWFERIGKNAYPSAEEWTSYTPEF